MFKSGQWGKYGHDLMHNGLLFSGDGCMEGGDALGVVFSLSIPTPC